MKLEFLDDLTEGGKFVNVISERLIRLYDFDAVQASSLKQVIEIDFLSGGKEVIISSLDFIKPLNCSLTLKLSNIDQGITTANNKNFDCYLTASTYKEMACLIAPFCKGAEGFQWLYDLDCPIDLLFSPGGTW